MKKTGKICRLGFEELTGFANGQAIRPPALIKDELASLGKGKIRKRLGSLLLLAGMAVGGGLFQAWAQTSAGTAQERQDRPLELAVTYDAVRANAAGGQSFWMQGGSVQVHGQFYHGLGVVADVAGAHAGSVGPSGVELDIVTATFGPRYTWALPHEKVSLFGQILAGEANGFHGVFPGLSGATDSANGLAVVAGGGMNLALSRLFAVRGFEADWVRTQLPNGSTNVQNNLRLGAGVVLRFR